MTGFGLAVRLGGMCPALDILSRTTRPCAVIIDAPQINPMLCGRSRTYVVGGTTFMLEKSELFLPGLTSSRGETIVEPFEICRRVRVALSAARRSACFAELSSRLAVRIRS